MAATVALSSASQNFLKYKLTADGAGAVNLDAAGAATPDLGTDSKSGSPLRTILTGAAGDAAACRAILERSDIEFHLVSCDLDALWFLTPASTGTKMRLTFTAAAADANGSYFIIGYRHSLIQ